MRLVQASVEFSGWFRALNPQDRTEKSGGDTCRRCVQRIPDSGHLSDYNVDTLLTVARQAEAHVDTRLVAIGNSRGVRLPKPLIEEAGLGERVSLRVVDGGLLIEPRSEVRAGWAAAARLARERGDDAAVEEAWPPTGFDIDEWEWESAEGDA